MSGAIPTFVEIKTAGAKSSLELAIAGDLDAYGEVYRAHSARLLRQAMTLCGKADLAEELAQDTLVEAWKSLRRYNGRCEFFTWLCSILLNRYRNHLRNHRARPVSVSGRREHDIYAQAVAKLSDQGSMPDEAAELGEQTVLVRTCIESLPAKHQQVIYLRFYVDDSLQGIAAAVGCSVGTVKSRLFHALEKLRGMNALSAEFLNLKTKD